MNDREFAIAEAAQSPAVPVVERNQCDGCNRGLQVCDDGLHREPSGNPVMACTRNKYTRSIPATELASLRLAAEALHALTDRNVTYIGNDAVLPFESNAQAFNHMIDARRHAKEAMEMLAAAPKKEGE